MGRPGHRPLSVHVRLRPRTVGLGPRRWRRRRRRSPRRRDTDGDGIWDRWEGARDEVDTDGDGTPDFEDADSDGDGIPDSIEGNPAPSDGEPADSDGDGIYDFRDDDSDGNGIPDTDETEGDLDGDGDPDFRDRDDDDDLLTDADEIDDPSSPADTDGDGMADYRDVDSDDDTISDRHESIVDTDGDGTLDRFDDDSDGDGWTDAEEAGDADPDTAPVDTDMDGVADFRDTDSDGDGLSDTRERELGTARDDADTDGDGVSDLVEIEACPDGDTSCEMDATDPSSSPRERGDFVFAMPYMMPPMPERDTLDFATDIRVADVYFLVDTTGSMGGPIDNVRASLSTPGTGIIDRVRAEISDTWFGVGGFDDYQAGGYGYASSGDRAYYHLQDLTGSAADAQSAVNTLATHYGGDGPESGIAALHAVATGLGLPGSSGWNEDRSSSASFPPCGMGSYGWPCFRPGAVPIVVLISDTYQHNGPGGEYAYDDSVIGGHAPTYDETVTVLTDNRIRVIGVSVGTSARSQMEMLATATGAVDGTGAPLVSVASSGTVSDAVVNQIRTLVNQTPIDISLEYVDDPSDAVDTWAAFVDHVEANEAGDPARGCDPRMAEDTDGDGYPDTFMNVTPGARVCFDIIPKQNDTVMPTPMPQLFMATLRVLGDGFTELDSRDVFFLVPPEPEGPGGPD
ncbi:MAG TPA: VWA domain-containing protein [Sandaracinaceae bacterium LLY-WYZ-13_1]|nr:VWA domain-containing protein [Sandaracinaceae bacterium LLY-WYZ-13_1]